MTALGQSLLLVAAHEDETKLAVNIRNDLFDGALPVLATKGLFAREGCPVKIRTGGMPRIV